MNKLTLLLLLVAALLTQPLCAQDKRKQNQQKINALLSAFSGGRDQFLDNSGSSVNTSGEVLKAQPFTVKLLNAKKTSDGYYYSFKMPSVPKGCAWVIRYVTPADMNPGYSIKYIFDTYQGYIGTVEPGGNDDLVEQSSDDLDDYTATENSVYLPQNSNILVWINVYNMNTRKIVKVGATMSLPKKVGVLGHNQLKGSTATSKKSSKSSNNSRAVLSQKLKKAENMLSWLMANGKSDTYNYRQLQSAIWGASLGDDATEEDRQNAIRRLDSAMAVANPNNILTW